MFILYYIATFTLTIFLAAFANKYHWIDNAWIFPAFYTICFAISLIVFKKIPLTKYRIVDYGLGYKFQFEVQKRYFFGCWKSFYVKNLNTDQWSLAIFPKFEDAANLVLKELERQTQEINYKKNNRKIISMDQIIKLKTLI